MPDGRREDRLRAEIVSSMPLLRLFAFRFHQSRFEIDDLVQETVLKALSNLDHFQEGTQLRSWLFTIMRNTFCTRYRVARCEAAGVNDDLSDTLVVPPIQEWVMQGHDLEDALTRLPEHYRTALKMIFLDGVSYEMAAEKCRCPLGTMKSRINRARSHLAKDMGYDTTWFLSG